MNEVSDCLLVERRGSTQLLRLNRPERHHAINYELGVAIRDAIERTEDDDTVRAIIITGSGEKAFCAGQDMLEMSGVESSRGSTTKRQIELCCDCG